MNASLRIALFLFVAGILLAHQHLQAQDKKDPPKNPGETVVNDSITKADQKDTRRSGSYCKTYVFKMMEGKTYQIEMRSADFDSYLRLEKSPDEPITEDDDGGGYPTARIVYRAPKTEDYTIVATTFSGGATGKYTVTIKEISK